MTGGGEAAVASVGEATASYPRAGRVADSEDASADVGGRVFVMGDTKSRELRKFDLTPGYR